MDLMVKWIGWKEDSFLRENFNPRFLNTTTENPFIIFLSREISK